jgi:hypothetical protein
MSPSSFIIFLLFVIIGAVLLAFGYQTVAAVSFFIGLIPIIFKYIPKVDIDIRIEPCNNYYKVVIRNSGSLKATRIKYKSFNSLKFADSTLPSQLGHETREIPIFLDLGAPSLLDIEVSWIPQFGLKRKSKRITRPLIER